ncbi:MucR family transcriptional regulator [Brucella pituitosa]|uniref:MucR family transcriptional regulator n=1 Tax=Brucella pituitosa TaxID=571256 RepID=A0A643ETM9_9HYPH|nr:MucR family transcriptional regulator [Brucella pituitosa]KAB0566160.1 MucR family transcriptional regulator [Brucella pituitosa]
MKADVGQEKGKILELTTNLVSAYASNNKIESQELVNLCNRLFVELLTLSGSDTQPEAPMPQEPAVLVENSITPDYLYCLEDGKPFKSLKRHLSAHYGMTPEQYREKWDLAPDYPMVAPNYSKKRSLLALDFGLGHSRKT